MPYISDLQGLFSLIIQKMIIKSVPEIRSVSTRRGTYLPPGFGVRNSRDGDFKWQ